MSRPRYRERAALRWSDLEHEQRYRIGARRRHNLAGHGWGIVRGLAISTDNQRLAVRPGLAIDGYGRELIVLEPILIPDGTFAELAAAVVDVWLVYAVEPLTARQPVSNTPSFRWRDQARLRVEATTATRPLDPRQPPLVPAERWGAAPTPPPSDDADALWPVFLGHVRRDGPGVYQELPLPGSLLRPHITLRGGQIICPEGCASRSARSWRPTGGALSWPCRMPPAPTPTVSPSPVMAIRS
jgi:hypothetical protein